MRVFVTGATGFIGSAVVRELLTSGHRVLGLARSDASAAALRAVGAEAHRGALDDLDSLRRGAAAADGVIHTAWVQDLTDMAGSAATDLRAVEAMGEALEGSGRPFVTTSGVAALPPGRLGTEDDDLEQAWGRRAAEAAALALADRGVRTSVVRPAPSVHGAGDTGFVAAAVAAARSRGRSAYLGDGSNRWPAVALADAAHLYCLALDAAPPGTRLHAVGEQGLPFREVAEAIGRALDLPVVSLSGHDAAEHFGSAAPFVGLDVVASNALTRERVGWTPTGPGLVADIDQGHYSDTAA